MGKLFKGGIIILGAIFFSTIGIFAADILQGVAPGIHLAGVGNSGGCTTGTVSVIFEGKVLCVDLYESSPGKGCPHRTPNNILETERNVSVEDCYAASVPNELPWTHISLPQAERMCSRAGKRLPSSAEWYAIALGTETSQCAIREDSIVSTGGRDCVSDSGVYDLIGNTWEWVDETVVNGMFNERPLPYSGYVTSVDGDGIAITTGDVEDELYGKDYVWTKQDEVLGMIRGGFYGSGEDAGLYTINASISTGFATPGIGFRCVQDVR